MFKMFPKYAVEYSYIRKLVLKLKMGTSRELRFYKVLLQTVRICQFETTSYSIYDILLKIAMGVALSFCYKNVEAAIGQNFKNVLFH